MGLQCSILGHAFEDAGVEREREEQGSEVVTTERTIERCRRCGTERVVSENTEVTAVVDADDVEMDAGAEETGEETVDAEASAPETGGGFAGAVERSEAGDADATGLSDAAGESDAAGDDDAAFVDDGPSEPIETDDEPPDPTEEDAEILTDDETAGERAPGEWPDEDEAADDEDETTVPVEPESPSGTGEESLSGITVPEGRIVCPECPFDIEANSGYRAGDPCPECNAWLEAERNQ